jgi:hypothetical protein
MLEMCFLYLKPDCLRHKSCEYEVSRTIETNKDLKVLHSGKVILTEELLRRQHPNLFTELEGDTNKNGFSWKRAVVGQMVGTEVKIFLVSCDNCLNYCKEIKKKVRNTYIPDWDKGSGVLNYIHATDDQTELENDVSIFLPKKLNLVKKTRHTSQ